ncbi:MAG: hypothetical protein ACREX4_09465 [Gammaproteobacteria bacterium]
MTNARLSGRRYRLIGDVDSHYFRDAGFDSKPIQRRVCKVHLAFSGLTVTLHPTDDVPKMVGFERVNKRTARSIQCNISKR